MVYLFLVNISLVLFFGLYKLALKPLTFFQWNRIYLLSAVILSICMPLLQMLDLSAHKDMYEPLRMVNFTEADAIVLSTDSQSRQAISPMQWVGIAYGIGVVVMFLWLCWRLYGLSSLVRQNEKENHSFSFFNRIFIGKNVFSPSTVYSHEKVHVQQGHSYDILFLEVVRIFNWFNPVLHWYIKELKLQHECIADEQCAVDKVQYAELLVTNALRVPAGTLEHEFSNHSFLKKRIKMLFKHKSKGINRWKYIAILPMGLLVSGVAVGFNDSLSHRMKESIGNITNLHLDRDDAIEHLPLSTGQDTIIAFSDLEMKPEPKGGMDGFRKWILASYEYPQEAIDAGIKGRLEVSFVVEKDGSLSTFGVVKDIKYGTAEALIETLKKADKWMPGIHNGKKVRVSYVLPMTLNLESDESPKIPAQITPKKGSNPSNAATENLSDVNVHPDPVGGLAVFRKWVQENYQYPQEAIDVGVKGKMEVSFVIEEDGSLSTFKAVKDPGYGTAEALIAVLKKAEKWHPAVIAGQPVRSSFSFPLTINLQP